MSLAELCAAAVVAAADRDVDLVGELLAAAESVAGDADPEQLARGAARLWGSRWAHSPAVPARSRGWSPTVIGRAGRW